MSERSIELEEKYDEHEGAIHPPFVERPDVGSWIAVVVGVVVVVVVVVFKLWGPAA